VVKAKAAAMKAAATADKKGEEIFKAGDLLNTEELYCRFTGPYAGVAQFFIKMQKACPIT
jgi:hypothetical protein